MAGPQGNPGKDGVDGVNGINGINGKDGTDGQDASPESVIQAIMKLPQGKKLKAEHIDGLEQTISALHNQTRRGYLHGGGVPSLTAGANITLTPKTDGGFTIVGSGGFSVVTTASVIDDANLTFVFNDDPSLVNINGAFYTQTGGAITWSKVGATVTLSLPVGTGGHIYGIK
jgi:hypothetical protein